MNILIINKYQDRVSRGAETFVSELAKRLSKNHEVDVLPKIYLTKRYDLIIPTNGRLQALLVRVLTWITGSKMIISGQSGIGIDDRWNLYCFPDAFVALSSYAKQWAQKINPFIKIVKIPNGVDLNIFKPKGKIQSNIKTILAVGAFSANKRHNLTIKAVSKISNIKLTIAGGGGEMEADIRSMGKNLMGKNIEVVKTTNDKMVDVYTKSDLLVFPTVPWESFGITMVEAMASGLAVVANDDPIRREVVGDAGLFVDPENIDVFAESIQKALSTKWGDKPRKQAEKFDWDKIATQYEELFNTL